MIKKQGLWFLTLTSLILVLSVYYITMPNELLISNNGAYVDNTPISNGDIKTTITSGTLSAMRTVLDDERITSITTLNDKLLDKTLTSSEKSNIYEEIKYISMLGSKEEKLENKIKETYGLDSFIKINKDIVEVTIVNSKHDSNMAVKIMRSIQEEFTESMYVSISFKE